MSTRAATGEVVDWVDLDRHLAGRLVRPPDPGYDKARRLYMSEYDTVRPGAVAYCASVEDVRACLRFARDRDLPAAPRGGGHGSAGYSTTTGLVIDVSGLDSVRATASTVEVGAGTRFVDLLVALAPRGLALPSGMSPTVSAGGYVQGGGFGLLTRWLGMACDRVVSAEVVRTDGRVVTCSAASEPDLYWALRGGGGGNFGVVTRYEMRPARLSRMVNYALSWPWDDVMAVLSGWQRWALAGPDHLGSSLLVVLPDSAPGAVPMVRIIGGWIGEPADLAPRIDALVSAVGSAPGERDVRELSYLDAMMEWYGCSGLTVAQCRTVGTGPDAVLPRSGWQRSRNRLFGEPIPDDGLAGVIAEFDGRRLAGHTRVINAFALGGAANRVPRTATAYVHRDTEFLFAVGDTQASSAPPDDERAAAGEWTDAVFAALDRYSNGESYQNYLDPGLVDWRRAYYAENYDRLSAVKHRYDPERFFRFAQAID